LEGFVFPDAGLILAAGLLLEIGAVTANGCNIRHILSGVSQLAISSIIFVFFVIIDSLSTFDEEIIMETISFL
jgi:uncharacterized membrane protein YedE/YeeE